MAYDQFVAQNIQPGGVQCSKYYKTGHIFFSECQRNKTVEKKIMCASPLSKQDVNEVLHIVEVYVNGIKNIVLMDANYS